MLSYEELSAAIRGAAIEVHKELGPGLLESAYEHCLCHELRLRCLNFKRQVPLPVSYKGVKLDCGYQMDILVEDNIVLELKSVDQINELHAAQLLTYLRLSGKKLGFLMNFNVPVMHEGIRRFVL